MLMWVKGAKNLKGNKADYAKYINGHAVWALSREERRAQRDTSVFSALQNAALAYFVGFRSGRMEVDTDELEQCLPKDLYDRQSDQIFALYTVYPEAFLAYDPAHPSHATFLTFLRNLIEKKMKAQIRREAEFKKSPRRMQKNEEDAELFREHELPLVTTFDEPVGDGDITLLETIKDEKSDLFAQKTDVQSWMDTIEKTYRQLSAGSQPTIAKICTLEMAQEFLPSEMQHWMQQGYTFLEPDFYNRFIKTRKIQVKKELARYLKTSEANITQIHRRFKKKIANTSRNNDKTNK